MREQAERREHPSAAVLVCGGEGGNDSLRPLPGVVPRDRGEVEVLVEIAQEIREMGIGRSGACIRGGHAATAFLPPLV